MPAAAVIREGQALSELTGRIGFVDCLIFYFLNLKRNFKIFFNTIKLRVIFKKVKFYVEE